MWHVFYLIENRASLFFAIVLLFYFTSRNSRYENLQVTIMKKLKLLRCPKTKRSRYALRKKKNFRGFRVSELENLGNMSVPLNSDSSYKSRFKYTKIWTEWKTERFQYDLKEKIQISEVSEFLILLYTQNRKLGNLGKF